MCPTCLAMALLSSLLYTFLILATVRVETESAQRLKDTFSSGTNPTGEAGATSAFESLPGKRKSHERGRKLSTPHKAETKTMAAHRVGRQPGSCPRILVPIHRWQRHLWQAGPPPGRGCAPDATPGWRSGVVQAASLCTRTQCSPQGDWWNPSLRGHCVCSEAWGERIGSLHISNTLIQISSYTCSTVEN